MINLELPEDIRAYILQVQGETKARKGLGKYSQQQTIISIIKEHKELKEKSKK